MSDERKPVMKRYLLVFVSTCLAPVLAAVWATDQPAQPLPSNLAIQGVTIVDVEVGTLRKDCTVIVAGDRIQRISTQPHADMPQNATRIIEGKGLFLIPGLIDAHVHYFDPAAFGPMMVANGVLFVRDMGGPTTEEVALRDKLKNGEIFGPEMITTGSILDGDPPLIPQICISCRTPEDGREAVRKQVAAGVDQIKVYSGLKKDVFLAIAEEANKLGVKPVGHTPESIFIEDAANAGLRSSEHPFGFGKIIAKLLGEPVGLSGGGMGTDVPYFLRLNEVNREEFRNELKKIGATGMHVCPTLVVFKHGAHLREIFADNYPMLEYVSPTTKGMWKALWGNQPTNKMAAQLLPPMQQVVKELQMAGIPLMVGTDLLTPGVIPGCSVHEEMVLWQEAGISPPQILRSATLVPAKFMGLDGRLGTVTEGKTASLVLLRSNPLEDIRNAGQIEGVLFRGRYFSRADLDRLREDVRKMCGQGSK
jgi:imidazolonepropionase-like amidohydrolase